jgi:engulfment/cell motility protein 1
MGPSPAVCTSAAPLSMPRLTLHRQVREELNHEALQFVKEQRIRCLLQGGWFPSGLDYSSVGGPVTSKTVSRAVPSAWRFVRLSHNRRYLHYADFDEKATTEPRLDALQEKSKCHRSAQGACLRA